METGHAGDATRSLARTSDVRLCRSTGRRGHRARRLAYTGQRACGLGLRYWTGGAWLSVEGHKVDLLYRNAEAVEAVIEACRAGTVTMDYQPQEIDRKLQALTQSSATQA